MSKSESAKAREHRLAAKLRENLRRRKASTAAPETGESGVAQKDGGQKHSGKK